MSRSRSLRPFTLIWPATAVAIVVAAMSAVSTAGHVAEPFVVHEWGTFSTFSGSDGKPLKFFPNDTDLPDFVHSRRHHVKGGLTDVLVSLETPVLYFYSDRDRTVSVRIDFPKGIMTDWYPEASRPPTQQLRWDDVRVLATDRPTLAKESDRGRYYAARDVDAATLRTTDPSQKQEAEKFLFYRGVGDAPMPFEVKARGQGHFAVKNAGTHAIPGHFLLSIHDHKIAFKPLGPLAAGAEESVALPTEFTSAEKVGDALAKALVGQGLYEKEAKAMVKTWRADWFGDAGTRVLYLVAEPHTAELLPLTIEPKPDRLVRVMVGRHDVLTPEREKDVDDLVAKLHGDSNSASKAADAALNAFGRYRAAVQAAGERRTGSRREP